MPLGVNEVFTLTTLNRGQKGFHGVPPAPGQFPVNYNEDFESEHFKLDLTNCTQDVAVKFVSHQSTEPHS